MKRRGSPSDDHHHQHTALAARRPSPFDVPVASSSKASCFRTNSTGGASGVGCGGGGGGGGTAPSSAAASTPTLKLGEDPVHDLNVDHKSKDRDIDLANNMIVKELNSMSLTDRELLFDEIHGVRTEEEETKEFVADCLSKFQTHLDKIQKKDAYNQAKFLSPTFVEDTQLRLSALRAEYWDPIRAAKRFVNHFQLKLELFGPDSLASPITQAHLTPGMLKSLKSGYTQAMPKKDRVGRTIVFTATTFHTTEDWKSLVGMVWYTHAMAMATPDDQRKGVVVVMYNVGMTKPNPDHANIRQKMWSFQNSCLSKICAYHMCYDDPILRPFLALFQLANPSGIRLRMRPLYGSHVECLYKLSSYGISMDMLPIDSAGNIDTVAANKRIEEQRQVEEAQVVRSDLILPKSQKDVVLGRGWPYQRFPGNLFLNEIVALNREMYSNGRQQLKVNLTRGIVDYICEPQRGGRFLKKSSTTSANENWIVVTDPEEARKKVSHSFRTPSTVKKVESESETTTYIHPATGLQIRVPIERDHV